MAHGDELGAGAAGGLGDAEAEDFVRGTVESFVESRREGAGMGTGDDDVRPER